MIGSRVAAVSQSGRAFAPPQISTFTSSLVIPGFLFTSGSAVAAATPVVFSGGLDPYSITVSPLIPGLTVRASDGQINAGTAGAVTASATYRFTGVDALSTVTYKDVTITIQASAGIAPQWVDVLGATLTTGTNTDGNTGAVLPSFPSARATAGDVLTPDLGSPVGVPDPAGYSFTYLRNGLSPGMPSASGVAMLTYTWLASDTTSGSTITCVITASNGGSVSNPVTLSGVTGY